MCWVLLMSFWMILNNSAALDEVLAGTGAAALAALAALGGTLAVALR